jgi:molecular chaperone GrpE
MVDPTAGTSTAGREGDGSAPGPVVRDRRRLDPETGRVREAYASSPAPEPAQPESPVGDAAPDGGPQASERSEPSGDAVDGDAASALAGLAEERLLDLQRLQAEFLNYKRRVERDRDLARVQAVHAVLEGLLPVLDDVHAARQAGELDGPFAAIAEKLEAVLERFGLARYGEPGEEFDPEVHEALVHTTVELAEGTTATTVVQVLQPGYRTAERVLRAARVAVADPS